MTNLPHPATWLHITALASVLLFLVSVQLQNASEITRNATIIVLEAAPSWARQDTRMDRHNPFKNYSFLPNDGAFLHLGKTGGSTLATQLRNGCHSFIPKPCPLFNNQSQEEIAASRKIQTYYHVPDFHRLPNRPLPSWMVLTLRDPYERTRSAFCYGHPRNAEAAGGMATHWQNALELMEMEDKNRTGRTTTATPMERLTKCFPTLQAFVDNLGHAQDYRTFDYPHLTLARELNQTHCQDFCRAVLNHRVPALSHLYFSMTLIRDMLQGKGAAEWTILQTSKRPKDVVRLRTLQDNRTTALQQTVLFVTRKEHLRKDWETINTQLTGETALATTAVAKQRDISHLALPVPNELNEAGRQQLCYALREEYESYVWFLKRAVNLGKQDIQDALERANRNCPELYETVFAPSIKTHPGH